jgi:hypothetical protein
MKEERCPKSGDHLWSLEAVIFSEPVEYSFVCQKCWKREKRKVVCVLAEKKTIWKKIREIFNKGLIKN